MSDRVTCTIADGVADVRLNRPEKINAIDNAMFEALVEVGESIKTDATIRAVVLSGEGRGFCSGLDFSAFQAMAGNGAGDGAGDGASGGAGERRSSPFDRKGRITNLGQQAAYVWTEIPAPVIAAIHGVALGGGCQIALGADIRICAPDARFSILEIRWGLIPDMTGSQVLPRLVGIDKAKELTWTGRMVTGEEAARIGLATRVSEQPREDAMALAAEIAGKSPQAIRAGKRLLELAGRVPLQEGFANEFKEISALIGSPDQVEAVTAFFEKRDPVFDS